MYFNKVETSNNFVYGGPEAVRISIEDCGSDVFRLRVPGPRWPRGSDSFAPLDPAPFVGAKSRAGVRGGPHGEITVAFGGKSLLASRPGRGFGVCGSKWIFTFPYTEADRFYGMGEKNIGFELSKKRSIFWNTDIFADFAFHSIEHGSTDPMYADFPVLIMKTGGHWIGIVVNNPHPVFMNTGAAEAIFQPGAGPFIPELFFGSRDGEPDVFIIVAERPDELVRRVQVLQGTTPLPPLWALGHQQCRWGYKSPADLARIADEYEAHQIPNDGLWLDIEYMDGFRVFTTDATHFPDAKAQLKALRDRGYQVVPILDPGLRQDPEFSVYAEAKKRGVLCRTVEGQDFIGYVWPGYTVFPDFSLPEGREFWAAQVARLTGLGFSGYWIDMNDPATGSAPLDDMLFSKGTLPHEAWHNQYALGMAVATREGLERTRPDERPFLISRSAFLGQSRYSAVWTGDNISNEHHMKTTIALSLNLSVSGMPFNGPDVPGFALDASADLMRAWYKLGFLFPFFRNHKISGARDQEPWTRDEVTCAIVRDYIRLRYKLLPYLYQLFVDQAASGAPMLRPVWYHDPSAAFETCDDQFFVGPAILQAPFVELAAKDRLVTLPVHQTGSRWLDTETGRFHSAGEALVKENKAHHTPIFLACPSTIPMQTGVRTTNAKDLRNLELLAVLEPGASVTYRYQTDDGLSLAATRGGFSLFEIKVAMDGSGVVEVRTKVLKDTFGGLTFSLLIASSVPVVGCTCNGKTLALKPDTLPFAGSEIGVARSELVVL